MPKKKETPKNVTKRANPDRKARLIRRNSDGLFLSDAPKARKAKQLEEKKKKSRLILPKKNLGRKTKPPYLTMLKRILNQGEGRTPVSLIRIYKSIVENYPVTDNYRRYVGVALKRGQDEGVVTRVGASYRLTHKGRDQLKRKKRKGTKKAEKKKKKKKAEKKKKPTAAKTKKAKKDSTAPKKKAEKKKAEKKKKAPVIKERNSTTTTSTPGVSPAGFKFKWQYRDGTWKDYQLNGSDVVEQAYQDYMKNPGKCDVRAVKSGQWSYQVDFLNLKQTNIQHESHTVRDIRRIPL